MMRKLTKVRQTGIKMNLQFKCYFGFLAWSYCSILKDEWKDIDKDVKDKIWDDLKVFQIYHLF
jgi:hypothetical protein